MEIGFIGTGVMGTGIIKNLLKAGNQVTVFNRTKAHAQAVLDAGANWAASPAEVTRVSEIVMVMVGFPRDVEQTYFGHDGILTAVKPDQVIVDMTTSAPSLEKRIRESAPREVGVLDAPVSGGDRGAKEGTLTVMVGGDRIAFERLKPIFMQLGHDVNYFGTSGAGQHAKMANQIMVAGTMTGLTEMLAYAKAAKLDLATVVKTVGGGAAANWSLTNYAPRILSDDYTPGFFIKHFAKDLKIALSEADRMGLELPATRVAKQLYQQLVDTDHGNEGTQALIKLWWKDAKEDEQKD